ncbi:energy-coupling factor ABC transporter ATP-binding protein [Agromyces atrinae]|uniref:energy-coupling factor ABC transporter ATP-binding protein n=1 Tax=Agromyces atrinae TaxID=592376 RepID=UPI001F59D131|nr:ABC transporter ATP-binding protein [Agromyces atrinae]MCI2958719.1 energy-coupling factor ABC transporter ATP-binding protein [Agromyces atrinae]
MAAVELDHVSFTYSTADAPTIRDLSFSVEEGELCALVGANGSGKTTVCNIVRGFIPRFHTGELTGSVRIDGQDIAETNLGLLGLQIGFVFQNPFVQISGSKDTVYEEVAFGLENLGVDVATIRSRVEETLDLINIQHLRDKNPVDLSGGQKQRVAFASTLAMDPPIFVIDEPTSQLDPQGTNEIFEIISLLKERRKSIILVEHKMELIAEYADSVVVLHDGALAMHGTSSEVFSSPELPQYGVAYPEFARAALALRDAGVPLDHIPVTKSDAVRTLEAARTLTRSMEAGR